MNAGDRFPVTGRVARTGDLVGLRLAFPSGRWQPVPVQPDGTFASEVSFDEEGTYRVLRVTGHGEELAADFAVAYRAELLDGALSGEAAFGLFQSPDPVAAVPVGRQATGG